MSKLSGAHNLADQESNWRKPRSNALAIPGAARLAAPNAPHPAAHQLSKSFGSSTAALPGSHFRRGPVPDLPANQYLSARKYPIAASYDKHLDPSSAQTWRANNVHASQSGRSTAAVNAGSQPAPLRKHHGFAAASNAAEVARRAFVASDIGSIGSPSRSAFQPMTVRSDPERAHPDNKGKCSPPQEPQSPLEPAVPLRPLRVAGFDAASASAKGRLSPLPAQDRRHEDWAITPTSTLPSLPSSPAASDANVDGEQGGAGMDRLLALRQTTPEMPSAHARAVLQRRMDAHNTLTNTRNQSSSPGGRGRFLAGEQAGTPAVVSSPLAQGRLGPAPSALLASSPRRTPLSLGPTSTSLDEVAAQRTRVVGPGTSPRLPSDSVARFQHSVDSPDSANGSARGLATRGNSKSPAGMTPSSRRESLAAFYTFGHGLQHSRRGSVASFATSGLSSPSAASIASSRPAYGVYRPPHLRNQGSSSGLKPAVAHYDRVRTPSLRGLMRTPDPQSRPASVIPPSIPEDAAAAITPLAPQDDSRGPGADASGDSGPAEHMPRSSTGYFDGSHSRSATLSSPVPEEDESASAEHSPDFDRHDDGFDMTHDEMIQTRTSLTDSYCLSRRSTLLSDFRIGNGVPVVDIFHVGDRLGPGMLHDGYPITIAETSSGFQSQQRDVTGTRLEVIKKLGEGSYAVVYLVQEVAADDGQIHVGPKTTEEDRIAASQRAQPIAGVTATDGDDADDTLADATIAGTLTGRNSNAHSVDGEAISSTLRASDAKPRRSLATMAAAQEEEEERARQEEEQHAGIDEPHEGRLFALKCLCKRDLSDDMLELQRLEATIHQSIPPHGNIVTLYRTYETPEWLFLVLEYCPGQDLFYWLEQAQDVDERVKDAAQAIAEAQRQSAKANGADSGTHTPEGTPPSPSLLASTSIDGLLSRRRLRLISKMFRQMCDSVQFCHDRGISHRDIKPENFIVEDRRHHHDEDESDDLESVEGDQSEMGDGRPSFRRISTTSADTSATTAASTASERKSDIVVKLTDFGLATAETQCRDFDCGSKPYMAYECRNNLTTYYDPQQADIWSLGIVLLNMIFHRSPFREPNLDRCSSFAAYCYDPIGFLMESFEGLPREAAEFLNQKVLCNVVPRPDEDDGAAPDGQPAGTISPVKKRVSAKEFAAWAKDLPARFGLQPHEKRKRLTRGFSANFTSPLMHSRAPSNSSVLPSMFSSPRPQNLVIEEDDDGGLGQYALFPEYGARRPRSFDSQSMGEEELQQPFTAGPTPHATQHRHFISPATPESLPSPTFSPPNRPLPSFESQLSQDPDNASDFGQSPSGAVRASDDVSRPAPDGVPTTDAPLLSHLRGPAATTGPYQASPASRILSPPQVVVGTHQDLPGYAHVPQNSDGSIAEHWHENPFATTGNSAMSTLSMPTSSGALARMLESRVKLGGSGGSSPLGASTAASPAPSPSPSPCPSPSPTPATLAQAPALAPGRAHPYFGSDRSAKSSLASSPLLAPASRAHSQALDRTHSSSSFASASEKSHGANGGAGPTLRKVPSWRKKAVKT